MTPEERAQLIWESGPPSSWYEWAVAIRMAIKEAIRPVRNDADYQAALLALEKVFAAAEGTDEADYCEVLSILVEAYEREHHAIEPPTPEEAAVFRLEQCGVVQEDGYPSEAVLHSVRTWNPTDGLGLLEFIKLSWWYPAAISVSENHQLDGTVDKSGWWFVSTVGWSGNESIIAAMQDNHVWWSLHWQSSKRGGHYEFKVRKG